MINYAIIEDERLAYEEIKRMMRVLRPNYILAEWAESVESAINVLRNSKPDLLIVDIRLSDGLCFDVFEHVQTNIPAIFTTAYDEYALQAFKINSIDYLLKPIEEKDLDRALVKFETNRMISPDSEKYNNFKTTYLGNVKKNRFLVSVGDTFSYIATADIAFFYSEEKYVYLHTFSNRRYIINYPLEQLETMLDQHDFFRVSRNCIANIKSIKKVSKYFGGRLTVSFVPECPHKIIVSRTRTNDCLKWLDDNQ